MLDGGISVRRNLSAKEVKQYLHRQIQHIEDLSDIVGYKAIELY